MSLQSILHGPGVALLDLVGGAALVYRIVRSVLRLGLAAAESSVAGGLIETSIRNGDLTAIAERQAHALAVRRARGRALLATLLWVVAFTVPAVAGLWRPVYAVAAILWFLPRKPIRLTATDAAATKR